MGENCIGWNLASNEFMELERGGIEEAHSGYSNDSLLQIYKMSLAAMGRSCNNVQFQDSPEMVKCCDEAAEEMPRDAEPGQPSGGTLPCNILGLCMVRTETDGEYFC